MNKIVWLGLLLMFAGCTKSPAVPETLTSQKQAAITNPSPTLFISQEWTEYVDDTFGFRFSYPQSLTFEPQAPYPGGSITAITFRVDGITESTLLGKDLSQSLLKNDLYCNLDQSHGSAVCTNTTIESYSNTKGTAGYKLARDKQLYVEDQDEPETYKDIVYAFPLKTALGASPYRVIVLMVKYPSAQNLDLLKQIADTIQIN